MNKLERIKAFLMTFYMGKSMKGLSPATMLSFAVLILAFIVLGIITSVGALINANILTTVTNTQAQLVLNNTTLGIQNVAGQYPLLGTIMIFGLIIVALVVFFFFALARVSGVGGGGRSAL